jgi:hypothetical protein
VKVGKNYLNLLSKIVFGVLDYEIKEEIIKYMKGIERINLKGK